MEPKQYLISLVNARSADIGDLREKILGHIDTFSEQKIVSLIASFERSEERKRRIDSGEEKAVIEELKQEKSQRDAEERSAHLASIKAVESTEHNHDEVGADAFLRELEGITTA